MGTHDVVAFDKVSFILEIENGYQNFYEDLNIFLTYTNLYPIKNY